MSTIPTFYRDQLYSTKHLLIHCLDFYNSCASQHVYLCGYGEFDFASFDMFVQIEFWKRYRYNQFLVDLCSSTGKLNL